VSQAIDPDGFDSGTSGRCGEPGIEICFETFVHDPAELQPDCELRLVLRDLAPGRRKYLAQNVVARVAASGDCPPGFVALRVRSAVGNELPGPWWVQVREVLPARLHGAPYSSVFDALRRTGGG